MNLFAWLSDHIQLIGWPTLIAIAWKTSAKVTKAVARFRNAEEELSNTQDTVNTVATNHLPHLQLELEKLNQAVPEGFGRLADGISGMRQDLLILLRKD